MALKFVQTVHKHYEGFTKKYVEKGVLACKAAGLIGYPSEIDFKYLVSSNLTDCPVTIPDVNNAHTSFGLILGGTRGNTVRHKTDHVTTYYIAITRDCLALHRFVSLVTDVMFFNNIPFLITISRGIKFVIVEYLSSRTAKELSKNLKRVMKLYGRGSMIVQTIFHGYGI